jgi:RNA polymerase sigma-70 factor (ECF subfamily)
VAAIKIQKMDRSPMTEETLVQGLRSHSKMHYEYLYDRYANALYGAILKIVLKQEVAEEILQDTFVRIWDKIDGYDPLKGRLFTWMVNIARNLSIDKLRSREMSKDRKTSGIDFFVSDLDKRQNTESSVDSIGVKDLLKKLPVEQEFVIEHLYFKGYTQSELAEEFNIPLGTVKTRLNLGIKKLQTLIKQH